MGTNTKNFNALLKYTFVVFTLFTLSFKAFAQPAGPDCSGNYPIVNVPDGMGVGPCGPNIPHYII